MTGKKISVSQQHQAIEPFLVPGLLLRVDAPKPDLHDHRQQLLRTTARHWKLQQSKRTLAIQSALTDRYQAMREARKLMHAPVWFAY